MTAQTAQPAASHPHLTPVEQDRRSAILVITLILAALVVGWFVRTAFQYRTINHPMDILDETGKSMGVVNVALPSSWVLSSQAPTATVTLPATFEDQEPGSTFKTTFTADVRILEQPGDPAETLNTYFDHAVQAHSKDLLGYQLLNDATNTTVAGQPAKVFEYAYVMRPIDAQMRNAPPVVVHAVDYIVVKGDRIYLFTEVIDQRLYQEQAAHLRAIVDTIQLP